MHPTRVVVPAIALAAAISLGAQQPAGAPPRAERCAQPLEAIPGASVVDTLFLALDPGYGIKPLPEEAELTTLSIVADSLRLPSPLPMPPVINRTFGFEGGEATTSGEQGMMAEAFVEFGRKGDVKRVGLTQSSLVPDVDAALVAAVKSGVANGAFLAYQQAARGPGGYVFIALRTVPLTRFTEKAADYIKQPPEGSYLPPVQPPKKGGVATFPVRELRVPLVRLTSPASVPKPGPTPMFPAGEEYARQGGFVHVEFVVGPDGHVLPGTFRLIDAMTPNYARVVRAAVESYTFSPAKVDDCPVAQRLTYTFTFEVR